jgi:ribosomal protein L37AE/L43A
MIAHRIEAGTKQWPRMRDMPRCVICTDAMVAPEASVLKSDGEVSYLWSCDRCGQSFVTQAYAKPPG